MFLDRLSNIFIHFNAIGTREPRRGLHEKESFAGATQTGGHEYKNAERRTMFTPDMEIAAVVIALIGYFGLREWLRHKRRALIHQERLAAIEKGVELPPLDQETRHRAWNVQRTLLLAGLIWISLGVCVFVTLTAVIASPANATLGIPAGLQWIGIGPAAIGLSHLVVYLAGRRNERLLEVGEKK